MSHLSREARLTQPTGTHVERGRNGIRDSALLALVVAGLVLVIDYSYVNVIVPVYQEAGFPSLNLPAYARLASLALALAPIAVLPRRVARPSEFVCWNFFLIMYLPACVIFPRVMNRPLHEVYAWIALHLVALYVLSRAGRLRIPQTLALAVKPTIYWFGVVVLTGVAVAILGYVHGFQIEWIPMADIYEYRASAVQKHSFASAYVYGWLQNALTMVLLVKAIERRSPVIWAVVVILILFLFSIEGAKLALSIGVLGVLSWYALRLPDERAIVRYAALMLAGSALITAFDVTAGTFDLTANTVRRTFQVPAVVAARYFEFFTTNPFSYMGDGLLRGWTHYAYRDNVPLTIGRTYWMTDVWANGGVLASAYSQFGIPGVGVTTLLLAGVLWVFDVAARGLPLWVGCVATSSAIPVFTNTSLTAGLLSHGVWLTIGLLFLLPRARAPA